MDCKEIQPVHSEGDQPWDFFGRNDAKAETPVLWPPHAKSWLTGKDSDAGRDWGQEEKGTIEDEMAGWHHRLNGWEFGWTLGDGDGQGGLACCDSWGRKESDMTKGLFMKHQFSSPFQFHSPGTAIFIIIGVTHKTLRSMHISLSTLDSMCFLYMKDKLYSLKLPSLLFLPIFDKLFLNSPIGYLYTLNCLFKSPVLVNFQHRLLTSWQLDKGVTISALFSTPLIHLPTFVSFT